MESLQILRARTAEELIALESLYRQCTYTLTVTPEFRVAMFDYLVHQRTILDYLAHGFVQFCSKRPPKLYFPLAKPGMERDAFLQQLNSRWMPGLQHSHPELFAYVDGVQWYAPGNETIAGLVKLVNLNKHVRLSLMEISDSTALVIENPGHSAIQVGDRGLRAVNIAAGATLAFEGPPGRRLVVRGPQVIDRETTRLDDADAGLRVRRLQWREFRFDEAPHTSAISFLAHVRTEVERICDRVLSLTRTNVDQQAS
jgi:hypothetical protein